MNDITSLKYQAEVRNIATSLVEEAMSQTDNDSEEAMELINDSMLHETIDGHEWIIYTFYNLQVIQRSENPDAMVDMYGSDGLGDIIKEKGLSGLHATMAFCALEQDVQEYLSIAMDTFTENQE